VVDLAAISNDPAGELDPELTLSINYRARARNAKLAAERGVPRYVFASSCSVYGRKDGVVDESAKPNRLTTYAKANLLAEQEVLPLASPSFSPAALRFATVYGPSRRMRFDLVVNAMTLTAYTEGRIYVEGDGMQMRPLVHVADVARAVVFMLEQPPDSVSGQVFNVGSDDQNHRIIDVAKAVQEVAGGDIVFRCEVDRRSYAVSFAKIKRRGGSPSTSWGRGEAGLPRAPPRPSEAGGEVVDCQVVQEAVGEMRGLALVTGVSSSPGWKTALRLASAG
jgi:nucleoside-diphosphate-sugar epimerase